MNRFDQFSPRERAVMKQSFQERADDDDPESKPWVAAAIDLYKEIDKDCGLEERAEADKMNKEGERYE